MKYAVKTDDNWWVGETGDYITTVISDRVLFDTKELADWYVKHTNVFGKLKVIKIKS